MSKNNSFYVIRFFQRVGLAVLFLLTTACTTLSGVGNDNAPPPTALVKFPPEKNLTTLWNASVGPGANRAHVRFETVVQNGIAYTVDSNGNVTAIHAANGKIVWSTKVKTCASTGPGVQSGYLVFGTQSGEVILLNAGNGRLLWRKMMSSQLLAPPCISGHWLLVKTVDGKLGALDVETGQLHWEFAHKTPLMILQGDSAPVVARGIVFVGFGDGQFFALSLQTGKLLWQQIVAFPRGLGEIDSMVDIIADPVVDDTVVFVAAYQGKLAALSRQTGRIIWQCHVSTYNNFAVRGNLVIVTDEQGIVWAIDRFNGQVLWQQKALMYRGLTAPVITQGEVWLGDAQGYLHVLSQRDGHFIARCLIDSSGLFVQPTFAKNGVLVRSGAGELKKVF